MIDDDAPDQEIDDDAVIYDEAELQIEPVQAAQPLAAPEPVQPAQVAEPLKLVRPVLADDGIGITLDEAINLFAMKHATIVGIDDPILMIVTLQNAFLQQHKMLFETHKSSLGAVMATELVNFVKKIDEIAVEISSVTSSSVVKEAKVQIECITKTRRDMFWLTAIMIATTAINLCAIFFIGYLAK